MDGVDAMSSTGSSCGLSPLVRMTLMTGVCWATAPLGEREESAGVLCLSSG